MFRYFWFSKEKSFLKNFINLVFWFFILLALVYFLGYEPTDHPAFSGIFALLSSAVLTLPHIVYQKDRFREASSKFLLTLESIIAFILIITWAGILKLYGLGFGYDSFVHFINSFLGVLTAFLFFSTLGLKKKKILIIGFFAAVLGGVFNEIFQFYGDKWWGTKMFGQTGEPNDTFRDIFYNVLGALIGTIAMLVQGEKWIRNLKKQKFELLSKI